MVTTIKIHQHRILENYNYLGIEEIEEFDEELYRKLIKQIVVYKDDSVRVIFPNNNSIKIGYRDL